MNSRKRKLYDGGTGTKKIKIEEKEKKYDSSKMDLDSQDDNEEDSQGGGFQVEDDFDELEDDEVFDVMMQFHDKSSSYDDRTDWKRPAVQPTNKTDLFFQQIEADYTNIEARRFSEFRYEGGQFSNEQSRKVPVVRFYGVNAKGNSVLCKVWGFIPYFYANVPPSFVVNQENVGQLKGFLNNLLQKHNITNLVPGTNYIENIKIVEKTSLWTYQFDQKRQFFQIFTGIPTYVPRIRSFFEKGFLLPGIGRFAFQTYESNVLFIMRSMIDYNIIPCSWLLLEKGKYHVDTHSKMSLCDIEVNCSAKDIICMDPREEKYSSIAPLRILSFDIECLGYYDDDEDEGKKKKKFMKKKKKKSKKRKVHFARANNDDCAVIQIANTVTIQGQSEPIIKNVFVLDGCLDIAGAEVLSFKCEADLLLAWSKFIQLTDPDIITGYNIINFDIPYLLDRAKHLKRRFPHLNRFALLGRTHNTLSKYKKTQFSSNQMGTRATNDVTIKGRVVLDVMNVVLREYKLSSYTLNNVSSNFLGQQKEDVHYTLMNKLHEKDMETRKRLAVYCLKDALLPQRLIDKLMIIFNSFEMCRVCGITMTINLNRGQQIKVVSQLLREAKKVGLIMPTQRVREASTGKFEGATVLKPLSGFYDRNPIATLDFASLYPSIMIAHNLCYTTLVPPHRVSEFSPQDISRTPVGHCFVKKNKYSGLLPEILKALLSARKKAKYDLKQATDPLKKAVLNGRQLALKVSANSVYGFTGAARGQLPCLQISSSVTAYGRQMIDASKEWVEKHYSIRNGAKWDAEVIYGDTDSVMINFGTTSIAEAIRLGKEAGPIISKDLFVDPIKLEFEKVYFPYLLLTKKRYAGLLYTKAEKYDKIDTKGIETVRRDKCGVVRNLLSTCLHLVLIKRDVPLAQAYVKKVIKTLLLNKLDISMLVISKTLSLKEYKNKQPHSELAERLRKRNPATAPKQGDRVNFVYIKKGKSAKDFEKSEDPQYVLKKNLAVDTQYYLERKLKPSLIRIFEMILTDKQMMELFVGDHTRRIVIPTPKSGGLMKYTQKKIMCLAKGCRQTMRKQEGAVCKNCQHKEGEIYEKLLFEKNHLEDMFTRSWSYCQRCQESCTRTVLCMNEDCPIFFMRSQVKMKLKQMEETMVRFDPLDW